MSVTPWKYRGATSVHYGSIAAIEFDPELELLWVCDSFGTVASFYCINAVAEELGWQTYCNLRCFPDSHPGCTGIRFVNNGVETLAAVCAANRFSIMKRGGANVVRQEVPAALQRRVTLFDVDYMRSGLVLAGDSPGLLRYTLDVPGEFVHVPSEGTITAMLSSDQWFATALTNGQVVLRDPSTLRSNDVVRAFNSRVSGLDGCDTTLLVASMERPNVGTVKVFDTRNCSTPVQIIQCNQTSSVVNLKFQAVANGTPRAMLLTPQGFHVLQLDQPTPIFSSTQSIESGLCSASAISSNGLCAAIGNDKGHFFALSSIPKGDVFTFSGGVQPNLPKVPNFTLQWMEKKDGSVDAGFSFDCPEEDLLSRWPEKDYMILAVAGKTRQVIRADPGIPIINTLGIARSCAYLADPKDKINQVLPNPYPYNDCIGDDPSKVSQILQDLRKSKRALPRARGDATTMLYAKPDEALQLCYHTHGTAFDWRNYNLSREIVGLDNTVPGSWLAPLLQCMYLCQAPYYPVRRALLRHWCTKQYCLSCEIAVLFSNMVVIAANGTAPIAQIGNLIRTMMQLPVFVESGIFTPATSRDDAVHKMHQAQKLLLEQMDRDMTVLPEHRAGLDPSFDFSELETAIPTFFGTQFQAVRSIIPPRFYWEVPASASKVDEGLQHLLKQLESYNGEQVQIKSLPPIIVLLLNPEHGHLKPPLSLRFSRPPKEEFNYVLCSNVIHLADDVDDPGNCVSQHRVGNNQYALVNDYIVSHPMTEDAIESNIPPITTHAVIVTYYVLETFRTPKLGTIGDIKPPNAYEIMGPLLISDTTRVGKCPGRPFLESLSDIMSNDLVALDAEYVVLEWANKRGDEPDYLRLQRKPHMSLARVSCIVSSFPGDERVVMDDYVSTPEPVLDYVTQYSGIHEGDLEPATSEKSLTTLKTTYMKLRSLADRGVRFVGHGLSQDFRVCNVAIPNIQVIDTLEIFGRPGMRKLSLRFLAFHVLGERVQEDEHDSIEDARTSLRLYRRYEEETRNGTFELLLDSVFQRGAETHWYVDNAKPSPAAKASVSPEPESMTPLLVPTPDSPTPGCDEASE
jgi:PAB-dependent poly(A)-specific ribonuclease subunit 2